ncbi:MAG: hypothetical protein ACD_15C00162G0009 [uncultured bacterium]|nr:MAG: hypothetical protein ACD_15C00162G0009 [uncultured bacterium]
MKLQKKHILISIISLIFLAGSFLRVYNFSNWLHFELDQSRDAKVVELAVEQGIGNLPLLGPKAAGSFLRLGPAFYNFEYLSAIVFGNTPSGIAAHNLIFSILAIGLFYVFSRRYFDLRISLLLMALFSSSLFLILYSRFAWNPNSLPFFILLAFYALLRAVDREEKRKGMWLMISALALGILTQLHFVAFLGIPTIVVLFLLIKRPSIRWTYWLAAVSIIFAMYLPTIINDIKTGGDNIKEFSKVFAKKSNAGDNTLIEKGIKNYAENSLGYFLMVSSYEKAELPKFRQEGWKMDVVCDRGCRDNLWLGGAAILFFSLGIATLLRKGKEYWFEKSSSQKDFIILLFLWFGVTFVLFTPIAYDFAPRFFLIIAGLPFIFLGLIMEFLQEKISSCKVFLAVFSLLAIFLLAFNWMGVQKRFSELSRAKSEDFEISADRILKEGNRVTLEQQEQITDYMEEKFRENNFPVYVNSEAFYRRSFLYHLEKREIPRDDFRNSQLAKTVYRNGNYFLIHPTSSNLESRTKKYLENYEMVEKRQFGTLIVFQLKPKEEAINAVEQIFGPEKKARSASGVPVRCRWNEIFEKCNPDEPEDAE